MRFALVFSFCALVLAADTMPPAAEQRLAREIYKQMIEVKSGFTSGSTTPIAESVAARFKAAGFPAPDIFVGGAIPTKANVVVRYRGTGARKPILLVAHIDVVEARREDWSVDPFVLLEKDGYFYGRGTADDKAQAAVWVATLRLKREDRKGRMSRLHKCWSPRRPKVCDADTAVSMCKARRVFRTDLIMKPPIMTLG